MLLVESRVEGQSRNVVLRQTTADVIRLRDAVRDEFALSMLLVKSVMKMLFLIVAVSIATGNMFWEGCGRRPTFFWQTLA